MVNHRNSLGVTASEAGPAPLAGACGLAAARSAAVGQVRHRTRVTPLGQGVQNFVCGGAKPLLHRARAACLYRVLRLPPRLGITACGHVHHNLITSVVRQCFASRHVKAFGMQRTRRCRRALCGNLGSADGSDSKAPDSPYRDTVFHLILTFPKNYPLMPPSVTLCTPLPHPNGTRNSRLERKRERVSWGC
jgi:hypothetical protein